MKTTTSGAQARFDYEYISKRMAEETITIGKEVTPITDVGEYKLAPNSNSIFEAGEAIYLQPGFSSERGARSCLRINYPFCTNEGKSLQPLTADSNGEYNSTPVTKIDLETKKTTTIFPNPSANQFTLVSKTTQPFSNVAVFTMAGLRVNTFNNLNNVRFSFGVTLEEGTYLVRVLLKDGSVETHKIIKL